MSTTPDTPRSHPLLILIRGLPGSGKSYLAHALVDHFGDKHVLVLDPDAIDKQSDAYKQHVKEMADEGLDAIYHPHRFLRAHAFKAIDDNKIIIWNQAFTNPGGFQRTVVALQDYAAEHNTSLPMLVVEVEVTPETAKARIADRVGKGGHDVPEDAWARFIKDYTSFADTYNTVAVHGEDDIKTSVATVLDAVAELA